MTDAAWQLPPDEAGECAAVFEALLVPSAHRAGGIALATAALRYIDGACMQPPPQGPGGYLWHREAPNARAAENAPDGAAIICMRLGDYVEDEWLLVGLLRDFSRMHPDLCIRVQDQDGEFLLIEAAEELPTWLRPENAVNRVWLCNGHLHIVPLECQSAAPTDDSPHAAYISVEEAVSIVRSVEIATQASARLEEAAFGRINFPAAAIAQQHTALAYLPQSAAGLLASHQQVISDAVHALTSGDIVSMRAAQRLENFPVADAASFPAPNVVLVKVPMTRPLYAELAFNRFFPPRSFGRSWQEIVEAYRADGKDPQGRWADIGAKLTAGLEMHAAAAKSRAKRHKQMTDASPAEYERFIAALDALGYFGSEVRHSARWKELEQAAMETARRAAAPEDTDSDAYSQWNTIQDGIRAAASPLDPADPSTRALEDSEDWLSVVPDELEGLDAPDEAVMGRLGDFMSRMGEFVNAEGDAEGAMFGDDEFDDEESANESEPEGPPKKINAAERERRMAELVPPLNASEWGESAMKTDDVPSVEHAARPPPQAPVKPLQGLEREHYDGASDSGDSLPDDQGDQPEDREARANWLGLERPADDVAMDNELDDFVEFARKTLGISEEQYAKILEVREGRPTTADEAHGTAQFGAAPPPPPQLTPAIVNKPATEASRPTTSATERADARRRAQEYESEMAHAPRERNPALNSFDAVLGAMEAELEAVRRSRDAEEAHQEPDAPVDNELDPEEAELLQHLLATGGSIPDSLQHFAETTGAGDADVEILGNFLESFKAQGSDAGPVGTLLGRLGVGALPRDTQ